MKISALLLTSLVAVTSGALDAENIAHLRSDRHRPDDEGGKERTRHRQLDVYPNDSLETRDKNCDSDELYVAVSIETDMSGDELAVYLIKEKYRRNGNGSEFVLSAPAMSLRDERNYGTYQFCLDDDSDYLYHLNIASIEGDGIRGSNGEIKLLVSRFESDRRALGFGTRQEEESVSFTFDSDGVTIAFGDSADDDRDCGREGDRDRCGEDFDYVSVSFDKFGWELALYQGDDVEVSARGDYT